MTIYNYLISILSKHNKSLKNIDWVGCKNFIIKKELFYKHIKKHGYYDDEDGTCKLMLPYDLLIVGSDFWIEVETNEFKDDLLVYRSIPNKPSKKEDIFLFSTIDFNLEKLDRNNFYEAELYNKLNSGGNNMELYLECSKIIQKIQKDSI